MNRFQKGRNRLHTLRVLLPVILFCIVLFLLLGGLSSVSDAAAREEASRLHDASCRERYSATRWRDSIRRTCPIWKNITGLPMIQRNMWYPMK